MSARFGIYYVPRESSEFAKFGAHWLGWDIHRADKAALTPFGGLSPGDRLALVENPAKYGFHATLKAPFRLAAGTTEKDLLSRTSHLAESRMAAGSFAFKLTRLGRFFALSPSDTQPNINALAAACVKELDMLRSPLTEQERRRRRPERLTKRQSELFDRWGYPFVLDEYRFHLTLTGPLDAAAAACIEPALTRKIASLKSSKITVDALTVVRQDSTEMPFRVIESFPLRSNEEAAQTL